MECRKLYYEDCHIAQFRAKVLSCEKYEKDYRVELDQTAFYPEGGGQAADTGFIAEARVLDTREVGERILHLCDKPLNVGETVECRLDYEARFHRMQQHTGEHMVSGILNRRYGAHNTGFHMGADATTIDFDVAIPAADLPAVEAEVNRLVWQDLQVKCWYPSPEELPGVTYRSKRALPWPVRIVEIPGVDSCACCGVHVARTGQVGLVKLLSAVPFRGGTRIEMLCGAQALAYLNRILEQNTAVSRAFSAKPFATGEAARQMNETCAALKYRITGLENELFAGIAKEQAGRELALVLRAGLDAQGVRRLADLCADCCGLAAVFSPGEGRCAYALVSRSHDLGAFSRQMNRVLQGKGGGKGGFCQGNVTAGEEQIRVFFANGENLAILSQKS